MESQKWMTKVCPVMFSLYISVFNEENDVCPIKSDTLGFGLHAVEPIHKI